MKKIVFYTEKWTNGGIETFIVNAIENLDRENYKIEIITSQKENEIYDSRLLKLNVDLHEICKRCLHQYLRHNGPKAETEPDNATEEKQLKKSSQILYI